MRIIFSYLKHVNRTFVKVDSILKTLQVQANPPEGLVQAYFIHVGDKSDTNFRKILELKGLKRQAQAELVDLFRVFVRSREDMGDAGNEETKLVEQSLVLSPLIVQGPNMAPITGGASVVAGLGSASLQNQMNRFDPRDFGSAIMSAARDSVDRLQTPNMMSGLSGDRAGSDSGTVSSGTSGVTGLGIGGISDVGGGGSDSSSGAAGTTSTTGALNLAEGTSGSNLNENLRNLGRFFRRETGRFGNSGTS